MDLLVKKSRIGIQLSATQNLRSSKHWCIDTKSTVDWSFVLAQNDRTAAGVWATQILHVRRNAYYYGTIGCFLEGVQQHVAKLPQERGCFNTQEFTRFLPTGVVSASSHALWRVLSNKVIRVFGHCWVPTHTHLWLRLPVFSKLFVFTVTVPPSDSDYVNRSAALQQFRSIYPCRARRLRSDEGGHQYQALDRIFCEMYWLVGVGGRGWAQSTQSGGNDIGDGDGFSVKMCKLSVRQSPCCLLDFCVLLPVSVRGDTFFIDVFNRQCRCDYWVLSSNHF